MQSIKKDSGEISNKFDDILIYSSKWEWKLESIWI
jgi:hypothetical protein